MVLHELFLLGHALASVLEKLYLKWWFCFSRLAQLENLSGV